MDTALLALVRDRKFIPLIYDYCDMWCARCRLTSRCLLFAAERDGLRSRGWRDPADADDRALQLARAVIEQSGPADKPIARLDLALCDVSTAPREPALGHPLEYLARHYGLQAAAFLHQLPASSNDESWRSAAGPLELLSRYHFLIAAKTYRALVSQHGAVETPELLSDALGSARIALIAIDRSLDAWRTVAATDDDARIAGLMELLEAVRTGIELRFPAARAFRRPGLDDENGG